MFYSLFKSVLLVGLFLSWISVGNCLVGFVTTQIGPKAIWNDTWVDKLKKNLLQNYDRHARPENHDVATTLKVGLTLVHLETDEARSTLIVQCWLAMKWTDSKLQWNPEDYGDIKAMRVADHEVWIPDIYLYNSAIGSALLPSIGNRNVVLHSHGEILWVPSVTYHVLCDFDLYYWPYDTQHCFIKFGSWVHSGKEIEIELLYNASSFKLQNIAEVEWDVDLISETNATKYECCVEDYPYAIFNLTLTRKSAPYKHLIITPTIVITFLILVQFWLPTNAKDKIVLNCLTAAVINIFLLYFNHQVIASGSTPLIVLFYSSSLYIVGITTITAIINYYSLCKIRNYRPFAWFTNFLLNEGVGKWLLLEDYSKLIIDYKNKENERELKEHNESVDFERVSIKMFKNSEKLIQLEWTIVSVFFDRFFFIFYSIVFVGLAIAFL